ncbi:MAG: RNA methyltransferase [Candidatus Eremiobacteraeota bacterium]|nr:RNA methyltransferase [Candidatus Eremiobacteraeota bacterium]
MPLSLGKHSPRVRAVQALLTNKGRSQQQKFAFEGWTLIHEAQVSGVSLEAVYVTRAAFLKRPSTIDLENSGTSVYMVDARDFARLSDLETPSGVLAVAAMRLLPVTELLADVHQVLLLADVNDPGNSGTLLRSAEAFGIQGVIFGSRGVQPHHPKVVRSAMGSFFRMRLSVASPQAVRAAANTYGFVIVGSDVSGEPIDTFRLSGPTILAIGHERRGLAGWESICDHRISIPMSGAVESLNAAVAGSILLYEASKREPPHRGDAVKTV